MEDNKESQKEETKEGVVDTSLFGKVKSKVVGIMEHFNNNSGFYVVIIPLLFKLGSLFKKPAK